ncbi:hypothetical protein M5D96_002528 [Drosophila gunungcola]|uniref:Uncharacterized protein n=1 Tax=Drosophila gunungcola TaxID=103775 RepID=A0A9Q0BW19_9MUSC|nr:hypothetical protein M5D96_002528 [Drosophila gunungcola]
MRSTFDGLILGSLAPWQQIHGTLKYNNQNFKSHGIMATPLNLASPW